MPSVELCAKSSATWGQPSPPTSSQGWSPAHAAQGTIAPLATPVAREVRAARIIVHRITRMHGTTASPAPAIAAGRRRRRLPARHATIQAGRTGSPAARGSNIGDLSRDDAVEDLASRTFIILDDSQPAETLVEIRRCRSQGTARGFQHDREMTLGALMRQTIELAAQCIGRGLGPIRRQ